MPSVVRRKTSLQSDTVSPSNHVFDDHTGLEMRMIEDLSAKLQSLGHLGWLGLQPAAGCDPCPATSAALGGG